MPESTEVGDTIATAHPRLAEHFEDLPKQEHAARLGMWLFLGSELLLFAGLLALYASYRYQFHAQFSAAAGHSNLFIGTLNTVVLITSSLTVALAVHAVRAARLRMAVLLLSVSAGFGLVFLALKGVEYAAHLREGIAPGAYYHFEALPSYGAELYFTLYYVMTGLHALHVTVGIAVLAWLAWLVRRGRQSAEHHVAVELGGLYWHLVDLVWIFLWPLLYLIR